MENKIIRVLMLLPNLRVSNGVTSYAMNYFRQVNHDRVKIDFAVYKQWENPYEEEIYAAGSKVYVLPPVKNVISHVKACRKILSDNRYDIIHDNSLIITYPIMKVARKKVPVRILHSHNSKLGETEKKEKRNRRFLPLLLHQANVFAACSDLAAKAMFGNSEYVFIPNFVNDNNFRFDYFTRNRIRSEMGVEGKKIIATVGRLAIQKNPFFALDVFDMVAERVTDSEYWWIGSGPLDQAVADYRQELKHADQIRLLGNRNDIESLYQGMDLFFLPSLFEGLPVTGIEAQVMGLPCLISDSVTKEVVYTDLVKFMALERSKKEWCEVICDMLEDIDDRRGRNDELMGSKFSSINAGLNLERFYRQCIRTLGKGEEEVGNNYI